MKRKLRIVFFAPHFAEYVTRLAIAVAKMADVLLVVESSNQRNECDASLVKEARAALTIVSFKNQNRLSRWIYLPWLKLRIRSFKPDLIHAQEQPDVLSTRLVAYLRRFYPIFLTVHDPKPHSGVDAAWANRTDEARQATRRGARFIHVHGAFCRAQLLSAMKTAPPVIETAHGVILVPTPEQRREPQAGRILMFGRMEAYKGLEVLLEAISMLQQRGIAFELVVAGRGSELKRLGDRIAETAHVRVVDKFLTPAEAVEEFQRAAVIVVPYLDATQSGVVAAAFGNTRPVIASRTGGLIDAVRDGVSGVLIPPGDANALAQALQDLLSTDETRGCLVAGAKGEAEGPFCWDVIAQTLMPAYESLLHPSGQRNGRH